MKHYQIMELKRMYHEQMKYKWIGGFIAGCICTVLIYSVVLHVLFVM